LIVPFFLAIPELFVVLVELLLSFLVFSSILFLFPEHYRNRRRHRMHMPARCHVAPAWYQAPAR
jgi:hypothetical protein